VLLFGHVLGSLLLRSSTSGALTHCMRYACWLRRQWSASGWLVRSRCGRFGDCRRIVHGARSSVLASAFGNGAGFSFSPGSFAPNKSFKPTPCRGVSRVLCATLARARRPATGRLNSGVRRQKSVLWFRCSQTRIHRFRLPVLFGYIPGTFPLRTLHCARSGLACVTGQWCVRVCRLLTSGGTEHVRGAPGFPRFGFSATASG
jgi:hypothetical protein